MKLIQCLLNSHVTGREWLRELLADLADDGLVDITDDRESTVVRLQQ